MKLGWIKKVLEVDFWTQIHTYKGLTKNKQKKTTSCDVPFLTVPATFGTAVTTSMTRTAIRAATLPPVGGMVQTV